MLALGFFTSAVISPLTTELAAVARSHEGVGCLYLPFGNLPLLIDVYQTHMFTVHSTWLMGLDLRVSLSHRRRG